jgi:riboflavin kinase/FMN adenylyltransferase
LVWGEREVELLVQAGATEVGVFRTGPWLLDLSAREFFEQVLRDQLAARGVVEGPNFAFGHDRRGDISLLHAWCRETGIDFEVVDETKVDGRLVSSSLIRQFLNEGKVEEAARFLGRPHGICGIVARGAGRGASLGFPTINLAGVDTLIPADGVYAALARINGQVQGWPAACNVGANPTFGDQTRKVEAHLVGFTGDLYGASVELSFLERLRSTHRFANLDDLLERIRADVDRTRWICEARR